VAVEEYDTEVKVTFAEIGGKFDQIMQSVDTIKEKQEEMASDISQIKDAVYHPDEGLYARLKALETWQKTSTRLIWLVITTVVGLSAATVFKVLNF
jgi:hypothetical protein